MAGERADDVAEAGAIFGLTARFKSGHDRNAVDAVHPDEVFVLLAAAAGGPLGWVGHHGRLRHFGFLDDGGAITKAGRAFLRRNALAILEPITRAVLREEPAA